MLPAAAYGFVLLMAAIAYWILQQRINGISKGEDSSLKRAIGNDWKGKLSPDCLYVTAIVLAFVSSWFAIAIYVLGGIYVGNSG